MDVIKRSITQPGSIHLLDGAIDPKREFSTLVKRSKSLNSLLASRRAAAEARRRQLEERARIRASAGSMLRTILRAASLVSACALGLLLSGGSSGLREWAGFEPRSSGQGVGTVVRAFDESSSRLEALRHGADGGLPILEFLDAIDALKPAFSSMGLVFEVSTKEITSNTAKLRRLYHASVPSLVSAAEAAEGSSGDSLSQQSRGPLTLQELVLAGQSLPGTQRGTQRGAQAQAAAAAAAGAGPAEGGGQAGPERNGSLLLVAAKSEKTKDCDECGSSGSGGPLFPWEEGHRWPWQQQQQQAGSKAGGKGDGCSAKGRGRRGEVVSYPPVEAFEAGRWLGFGLHFMEACYECLGRGKGPGECALSAYEVSLKSHQNVAMRAIARSLLRVVPLSQQHLLSLTQLEERNFAEMMARWARAIKRHRGAIVKFYGHWPAHTA